MKKKDYSLGVVARLLTDYCVLRSGMTGSLPQSGEPTIYVDTPNPIVSRDLPFGYSNSDMIPFRGMKRAAPSRDGKQQGRNIEDLHCAVIDLEEGIRRLDRADFKLLKLRYLEGYEVQELAKAYLVTEGAMEWMIQTSLTRLTAIMNGDTSARHT